MVTTSFLCNTGADTVRNLLNGHYYPLAALHCGFVFAMQGDAR